MNVPLALRRRAMSNMRAGDSIEGDRRAVIDPKLRERSFQLHLKCNHTMNSRGCSLAYSGQAKRERKTARNAACDVTLPPLPVVVLMTRQGPRRLDDDNTQGALKKVRDGIADAYGVDDGDARYRWEYAQERSKTYGVRVEIRAVQP